MLVSGVEADELLIDRWRSWLMPAVQPYLVPGAFADAAGIADGRDRLTPELRDSFWLFEVTDDEAIVWCDRASAGRLPAEIRRAQPAKHRWPRRRSTDERDQVIRYVEDGLPSSRHRRVSAEQWSAIAAVLPGARGLAGAFPAGSGQNCFAVVMGAAGVPGASGTWMQREPFEMWLADAARPVRGGDELGTVYVWRSLDNAVQHAALSLGSDLALHKASQGWMSPRVVLTRQEVFASSRVSGRRLQRYRLNTA